MKLPKMYAPTNIKFWSLRDGLGANLGMVNDIDTEVTRKCRRVKCEDGWKWQIVNFSSISDWDYCAFSDKETLDNYGSDLEFQFA